MGCIVFKIRDTIQFLLGLGRAGERANKPKPRGQKKAFCLTTEVRPLGTDHWVGQQNSPSTKYVTHCSRRRWCGSGNSGLSLDYLHHWSSRHTHTSSLTVVFSRYLQYPVHPSGVGETEITLPKLRAWNSEVKGLAQLGTITTHYPKLSL